jgi:hypothetical protein
MSSELNSPLDAIIPLLVGARVTEVRPITPHITGSNCVGIHGTTHAQYMIGEIDPFSGDSY